jgi:hypothetical protein
VPAGEQIRVGAGYAVEELAEDHGCLAGQENRNLLPCNQQHISTHRPPKRWKIVYSS